MIKHGLRLSLNQLSASYWLVKEFRAGMGNKARYDVGRNKQPKKKKTKSVTPPHKSCTSVSILQAAQLKQRKENKSSECVEVIMGRWI